MWVQWSCLEWHESSKNPMAREQKAPQLRQELVLQVLAALRCVGDEHQWQGWGLKRARVY